MPTYWCWMKKLALLVLLTGCAMGPTVWDKPGGTESGFAIDRHACLKEATIAGQSSYIGRYGGYSSPTTRVDSNLYSACLQARGWRLVRAGVPPPMVPPPPQAVTPPPQAVASAAIAPPQAVAPSKADDPYVQLGHEFARSAMTSLRTWRHPTKAPYTWMPDGSACMQLLATPESNEALTYEFVTSQSPAMIDRINKNRYDPQVVAAFRVFFNEAAWERIRSCMRDKGWQEAKR